MTVSDDLLRNYFVKLMKYAGAIIRVFSEKIIEITKPFVDEQNAYQYEAKYLCT